MKTSSNTDNDNDNNNSVSYPTNSIARPDYQACISIAQLSRYAPNRAIIAGKGGVAAMVRLLEGFRREDRVTVPVGFLLHLLLLLLCLSMKILFPCRSQRRVRVATVSTS